MSCWKSEIKDAQNHKVLLMLSGGKDSITTLILLKEADCDVTAIHFTHKWSSDISKNEAISFCEKYNTPLIIQDFSCEFSQSVIGYSKGRPCLICKKRMYEILLDILTKNNYGFLAIGDNKNDRTSIARMKLYLQNIDNKENFECNRYLGSEMGIVLPKDVKVIRPLISMSSDEIESYLQKRKIKIKRINSTGDKYFEYHREGCFAQFIEAGQEISEEILLQSKIYNECITEFARKEKILASVHLPSTFIVTIPKGYEKLAADYLEAKGLHVDKYENQTWSNKSTIYHSIIRKDSFSVCHSNEFYNAFFYRFCERLELPIANLLSDSHSEKIFISSSTEEYRLFFLWTINSACLDVVLEISNSFKSNINRVFFENIVVELFKTRNFLILVG